MHKWESKVFKAYGRMVERSPTVNKLTCDAANLVQVGFIEGQEILVRDMDEAGGSGCSAAMRRDSMPESAEIHA